MPPSQVHEGPTVLTGRAAYEAAMQDSTVPIYRRDRKGRLELLGRDEATRMALMGNPRPLYVEMPS